MLTDEQREAAIERMAAAMWDWSLPPGPRDWAHFKANWREHADPWIARAVVALDALLSEFVVIAEDDVTEERDVLLGTTGCVRYRRLVTRWEPITNEDVGPWTTQETP